MCVGWERSTCSRRSLLQDGAPRGCGALRPGPRPSVQQSDGAPAACLNPCPCGADTGGVGIDESGAKWNSGSQRFQVPSLESTDVSPYVVKGALQM